MFVSVAVIAKSSFVRAISKVGELFQSEMRGRPRKDIYNDVCGLWNDRGWLNDNNKVLLSGHTQKDVTIPKNTKVLVMKNNPQEGTRQPNAKILYVTHED